MTITESGSRLVRVLGILLLLACAATGVLQLGSPGHAVDPAGFLFVLAGGIFLAGISYPIDDIRGALSDAASAAGPESSPQNAAHFWEAAGRGFWILGVLCGLLTLKMGFVALAKESSNLYMITDTMARSLAVALFGFLLAMICYIPRWKIAGESRCRMPPPESSQVPATGLFHRRRFGVVIAYILFVLVLAAFLVFHIVQLDLPQMIWMGYRPGLLFVLGGSIALMLFMGRAGSGSMLSAAFAAMGFVGCLIGSIQMLHSTTIIGPQGIAQLARALAFVLSSCSTALLGMALVGAPLEDREVRAGRRTGPSVFSRVSWYVFPLIALMFAVLVYVMLVTPMTPAPMPQH